MDATLICLILLAISYINGYVLLKRLKTSHHDTWVTLGTPKFGDSNLSKQWIGLLKFVWRGSGFRQNDYQLAILCVIAMTLEIGIVIAFLFVLI
jgi:hypothetical protein